MPDRFRKGVKNGPHPHRIAAPQDPGRLLVDIAVRLGYNPPDRLERDVKRLLYHMVAHRFQEIACGSKQPLVGGVEWPGFGHRSVAVAVDHDQHALRQIAEIIGEVAVQTADNDTNGSIHTHET